jgi:hypothetical protein
MSIFRLTMLPASEGDCLILSYGPDETALRHIIVDGGRKATWPALKRAIDDIEARGETIELLLLTHIDADHIDGLIELATDPAFAIIPKAVWYNGYDQLKAMVPSGTIQPFGFRGADAYSRAIAARGWPLNKAFGGKAIFTEDNPAPFEFAGLTLTMLSPDRAKLDRLRQDWQKAIKPPPKPVAATGGGLEAFGKRPMPAVLDVDKLSKPSSIDTAPSNGSSIALIAEYGGRRVLLGADAHPDVVVERLAEIAGEGSCQVDLVKLPHHGSRANVTREMLEKLDCDRFAISTSGAVFGHPDPEAISRVLKFGSDRPKTLYFNYTSERTLPWNDPALTAIYSYRCIFPDTIDTPVEIDI